MSATQSSSRQVVVVGAGPGGYVAAIRLAQLGHGVTLIHRDQAGGTCLHWGCIPSKALIQASHQLHTLRHQHLSAMGINVTDVAFDMARLQQWKQGIIDTLTGGVDGLLKRHKITVMAGTARFLDADTIEVLPTAGGTSQRLTPDAVILATGAQAVTPGFLPVDGQWSLFAQHLLVLPQVPDTLGIVGAGIIGLELGMMMAQLGAKVWMVEAQPTLLPDWDRDVVQVLEKSLKSLGIDLYLGTKVTVVRSPEDNASSSVGEVMVAHTDGRTETLTCHNLLVAVGRAPATKDLNLEVANIALEAGGRVAVDGQFRTSNPKVWAIGDLVEGPQLAHKASKEGLIAAEVIHGLPECRDWRAMPLVVFTQPEMASVGLSETAARAQGLPVRIGKFSFGANGMALALHPVSAHGGGFVKLIAHAESDQILGAVVVGPQASALIAEVTLAMELGAAAEDLALTIHAHPTLSEPWVEAAEAVHQRAIHLYQPLKTSIT